jgi:hypothetical protein
VKWNRDILLRIRISTPALRIRIRLKILLFRQCLTKWQQKISFFSSQRFFAYKVFKNKKNKKKQKKEIKVLFFACSYCGFDFHSHDNYSKSRYTKSIRLHNGPEAQRSGGEGGSGEEPYQASVVKRMMGELQHLQQHL